ncbi:MAG: hypothetical protein GC166_14830 [Alphaproteobacteria bacterium]|nr:hypothetical protein [Alphaproteobacteria bacterium]
MTSRPERIASCSCGKVQFKAVGEPIVSAMCYCADCQAGGAQLEAAGARADFRDAHGGTWYLTYRNDRVACVKGEEYLRGFKLSDDAPTTRTMTTCCNSAMCLKFGPGWWTSMFRVRFGDDAPPLQSRNNVRAVTDRNDFPADVPVYDRFPMSLFAKLMGARIAMMFGV